MGCERGGGDGLLVGIPWCLGDSGCSVADIWSEDPEDVIWWKVAL